MSMTKEEALAEAQRRWGKHSKVVKRGDYYHAKDRLYFVRSPRWAHVGSGDSWEAAFADAERKS